MHDDDSRRRADFITCAITVNAGARQIDRTTIAGEDHLLAELIVAFEAM